MCKGIIVCLLLVTVATFTGCGGKKVAIPDSVGKVDYSKIGDVGGLSLPLDTKYTQIDYLVDSSFSSINDSIVAKKMRDITGLNINLIAVPRASLQEKVKIYVASKDMPDIFGSGFASSDFVSDLGTQGAFAPLNKYLDKLPNLKKIIVDTPENDWYMDSFRAGDGNVYLWPKYDYQRDVNHGFMYRKDIFDKNGIQMWKTPAEFKNVLQKLKKLYPDSTPYASKTGSLIFNQWSASWGLNAPGFYYNESEKMWKLSAIDPKYKEMLDYMRELYVEKLIDPEFLTCTQASWTTKMTQKDKAFVTFDWIGRLDMFREQAKATVPEYELRYGYPVGPTGNVVSLGKFGGGSAVANNKKSELSLKLLDFLISPAGAQLLTLGVEGETFVFDEKGKAKYLGFEEGKIIGITDLEEKYGMFVEGLYKKMDRRSIYFNYTQKEQEAQDMILKENRFEPADPIVVLNENEKAVINEYQQGFNKAAEEFSTSYVLGTATGDKEWENWVKRAEQLGAYKLEETQNSAQARLLKK